MVLKNILQEFASILSISGIITIVLRRQTTIEIVNSVAEKTNIARELLYNGIICVDQNFRSVDFRKEIQHCKSEIDIYIIYASTWLKGNLPSLIEFSKQKQAAIRLCFLNPESKEAVSALENKFKEGDLKKKIKESIHLVVNNFSKLPETKGKIKIYLQNFVPQHSLFRFDNKLYLLPYNLAPGRADVPIMGFEALENKKGVFFDLLFDFEKLISNSQYCKEYKILYEDN